MVPVILLCFFLMSTMSTTYTLESTHQNDRLIMARSADGIDLTRHDFGSLLPAAGQSGTSAWLNDEIVNAWFAGRGTVDGGRGTVGGGQWY